MTLVMGVDSSTQSTKIEVRDLETGALIASGRAPHPSTTPPRSEQDPAAWWTAFEAAFEQASRPDVAALSVAGQQHGMVVLDGSGSVIRPAKLWNDTETAPDAGWLLKQLSADGWAQRCGSVPVAAFTISKLSWLHRREPESWARLATVLLPHDWLTLQLTGRCVTDRGDASGTGYWSPSCDEYCWDLLSIIDNDRNWRDCVPQVLGAGEAAGDWNGVMVASGTGDNMAAALGVGLRSGDVVLSLGTSGTVYALSDTPTHDATGAVAGFADADGGYLPLVCTLNATKVTDAVARLMGVSAEALSAMAMSCEAGARGLTLLPYLDGERTPNLPSARGVLAGVASDVSREQLARAAFEGVACGLLDGLDALRRCGVATDGRLLLVGGGAKSAAYRQVVADLTQREVLVPKGDEHVAVGACVQAAALASRGSADDVAAAWGLGEAMATEPRPIDAAGIRDRYAAVRDRQ